MSFPKSQSLTSHFCFLSVLLFLSSTFSVSNLNDVTNLIDVVCPEQNYSDCASALNKDPKAKSATTYLELAKIGVKLAIGKTSVTQDYINKLLEKNNSSEALHKCSWAYERVTEAFKSSFDELDGDALMAIYDVRVVGDFVNACELALASSDFKDEIISAGNKYAMLYSQIGFWIMFMFS